ncbi:MAG: lysyl-tRNA synthetase, class [Actinomycetota bacterium]|nr:lysyl-tRNA synthetase, class [Actinomycetota bacterium]
MPMTDPTDGPEEFAAHEGLSRGDEVLRARRESLQRLRESGVEPFAIEFAQDTHAADIHAEFPDGVLANEEDSGRQASVAGRVVLARRHGKLTFLVIRDATGDLQLFCEAAALGDGYALLDDVDLGDIIGATGHVVRTRRGEISLKADSLALLTKALRPLPEKWHGLKDPDLQQRRRYLHLIADETPRRHALARAIVLKTIRAYLDDHAYIEFEGPILQPVAGGANARPFTTFHNVLNREMKLRISLELYLKRMLVGGIERVYEIGRNFRNEGIDRDHNPEFTMLEAYQAYGDYSTMMELTEDLIVSSVRAVAPIMGRDPMSLVVPFRGREVDLTPPFRRITILGSVSEATGESVTLERTDLRQIADRFDVGHEPSWGPGKIIQELFEKLVEGTIVEPTFVCDFPREVSPLARPHRSEPGLTEHFDLVIGGLELVTAFSELTDPDEQRARFEDQLRAKEAGDEEAHPLDEDFLRALEHGMPPTGGMGMGIDRLLMLLTDAPSLRDLIMFPSQRPESAD